GLLLATRQLRARVPTALLQHGECPVHAIERPVSRTDLRREQQILLDRQRRVDTTVVGDIAQPGPRTLMRREPAEVAVAKAAHTGHLAVQAHDAAPPRRLAGTGPPGEGG